MDTASIQQELGRFIVLFQAMDNVVNEIIILISGNKEYVAKAFLTKTEFSDKMDIADVIFTHFVEITGNTEENKKNEFHELMNACKRTGKERNNIIHSVYSRLQKIDGSTRMIQENPKLKFKGGSRIFHNEKELSLDDFKKYTNEVSELIDKLEKYRLKIIEWKYSI